MKTWVGVSLAALLLLPPAFGRTNPPQNLQSTTPDTADGPPPAPLPAALSGAHKLFLGNAGDQENADCLRAYNGFYAALTKTGRYELVPDPAGANLVLEIHYEFSFGAGVNNSGANTPRQFRVLILDPKSRFVLWSLTERTNYAVLQKNRNKNLDEMVLKLADDLDALLSSRPPDNHSRTSHGLFH